MPKPRTCTKQIALDIRRFGLDAVRNAVEMAVALSTPAPQPRKSVAKKLKGEAASAAS